MSWLAHCAWVCTSSFHLLVRLLCLIAIAGFLIHYSIIPLRYSLPAPQTLRYRTTVLSNGTRVTKPIDISNKFPRIIHQTWKTGTDPPHETVRWREGCRAINPEYEFRMYNDDELLAFVKTYYVEYLPLFNSLHGVCKYISSFN